MITKQDSVKLLNELCNIFWMCSKEVTDKYKEKYPNGVTYLTVEQKKHNLIIKAVEELTE